MKVTKSISVDIEFIQYINNHNINISRWVNQKMKEEFKSKDVRIREIEEDIKEKQRMINEIRSEDVKKLELLKDKMDNLSEDAKNELLESKEVLEKDYTYFNGRFNRFRNLFDKTITADEFKIVLNNIKK